MNKLFSLFLSPQLKKMAAQTPPSRDRYVDFLRGSSILVVVFGHWLSTLVSWDNSKLIFKNAVGLVPGLWATTWILQVMPIFFFVGGFSNFISFKAIQRRGESIASFYRTRAIRLLKPTAVFILAWVLLFALLYLTRRIEMEQITGSLALFGPLWFLFFYLIVILLTPFMVKLHDGFRFWVPATLITLTLLADLFRFWLNVPVVSFANFAFVWILVHQLGFFYADGTLTRAPRWLHFVLAFGSLALLVILTNIGVYPKSMVGTGFEKVSNMTPPTICILVLTFWLVGAAMLLRDRINQWLSRLGPWSLVILTNSMIMTIYLWHLTAYITTHFLISRLGFGRASPGSLNWWLERPLWIIGPAIILVLFVIVFSRFERPPIKKTREEQSI
jgi:peptidoglycan/LPS O-acetylase OafA/YrhL